MLDKVALALELYREGAIQFGEFLLKIHEENPDAPRSPIFLNLRKPPKGKLTDAFISEIGKHLFKLSEIEGLSFDRVVGLPKAGDPLADAFINASKGILKSEIILRLEKVEENGKRRILPGIEKATRPGTIAVVVDDLVSGGDTKFEGIDALRTHKFIVDCCVVLIDRQLGGKKQLANRGVELHSVFTIEELLGIYVENGCIDANMQEAVLEYPETLDQFIKAQK